MLVIVPPDLVEGFELAGARAYPAADVGAVRSLLIAALEDAKAGIVGVAEKYYAALDSGTRRAAEHRYRPVVVEIPTDVLAHPEEQRRAVLQSLIRRAVGLRVVLGEG